MPSTGTGLLRPKFFERQQLAPADLTLGVDYGRERLRRHNRYLHGWGAVCGALVSKTNDPWQVQVSEGYVVTPHGDEVYIPANAKVESIQDEVMNCLQLDPPCPEPDNLEDERIVKILRANLDPLGKDIHGDYNREWLQIKVLRTTNLNGFVVQHTIYPKSNQAAFVTYYTFKERTPFAAGTIIRIHSGAEADLINPETGILHRYVADPGERGNWRLNNPFDTIRILDASGRIIDQRDLERQLVYLTVSLKEEDVCKQPAVPEKCQPSGSVFAYSRTLETCHFAVVCQLPPSHQDDLSCATLEAIVCRNAVIPCPPAPARNDNAVVLAAIAVSDEGIIEIDNESARRQLLSESLLQAYLRCQCQQIAPPSAAFAAVPVTGDAPLTVQFTDQSSGEIDSWLWTFGDGTNSAVQNPSHIYSTPGTYTVSLRVSGPGGHSDISSLNLVTVAQPTAPLIAAFMALPELGFVPLTVRFTDQSTGDITDWFWTFGDGRTSRIQNPLHVYNQSGLYTVQLLVTGSNGTDSVTRQIQAFQINIPIPVDVRPDELDFDLGKRIPIRRVPGIGPVRDQRLRAAGINTIVELITTTPASVAQTLGVSLEIAGKLQQDALLQLRR